MIEYINTDKKDIINIRELWNKLNLHHLQNSVDFKDKFNNNVFETRIKHFLDKIANDDYLILIAKDIASNKDIGYCISSIKSGVGEVDSIYIDTNFRGFGVGKELMERVLTFFSDRNINKVILGVASGNEDAIEFYSRFGFKKRTTILELNR